MSKILQKVALVAALALSACAGPGTLETIPVDLGGGQKATIYVHNQQWPSWMLATDKLAFNYVVKGEQTEEQLTAIAGAEKACRIYTNKSRPNELVGVLLNGTLYAVTGFLGTGGGAALAFKGASFRDYGEYGGTSYGGGGVANGIVQEGGKVYTFQNCGREIFSLFDRKDIRIMQTSPY